MPSDHNMLWGLRGAEVWGAELNWGGWASELQLYIVQVKQKRMLDARRARVVHYMVGLVQRINGPSTSGQGASAGLALGITMEGSPIMCAEKQGYYRWASTL